MSLLAKATDASFYDSSEIDWHKEGDSQSPARQLIREYLERVVDVKDKTIVDIGSGTGAFFSFYKEKGAADVEGIEPSRKNFEVLKKNHPDVEVFNGSFDSYKVSKKFNRAISLIVFEHLLDLDNSFKKVCELLNNTGIFYLVVANMDYFLTPRFDYELGVQNLSNNEYVVASKRSFGTYYDILRPIENYASSAKKAGLTLKENIEIKPTHKFLELSPKYEEFKDTTIFNLLVFEKTT